MAGSPLLADVIREMGFKKGDDFYIALGQAKISPKIVTSKLMQRLKQGEGGGAARPPRPSCSSAREAPKKTSAVVELRHQGRGHRRRDAAAGQVLPAGAGRPDRRLHLARQGHHDPPRELPERPGADEQPGALHQGRLGGRQRRPRSGSSCRSTAGTAPACSRTSRGRSPRPASTSSRRAARSVHPMVKNRFVVEVGDTARAEDLHHAAAQHRLGVRRLPRHADRLAETASSAPGARG